MRASIDHKWLTSKSQYTTNIYFSDVKLTAKERALILGSAFLLVISSQEIQYITIILIYISSRNICTSRPASNYYKSINLVYSH